MLGDQLGSLQVADPDAAGQVVGVEAEDGVLQVRLQYHAMAEQAVQHTAKQQVGVALQPEQGGLSRGQAKAFGTLAYTLAAYAVAVQVPGEQRHGHLRLERSAARRIQVPSVEDAEAFGDVAGRFRIAQGAEVEGTGGGLGHQLETRPRLGQFVHDRRQQAGQGNGAVQLVPGVLAHAIGQPHVHRELEEILQIRVVQGPHR
ncbi:hypothetical protein D9M71_45300 [compost metagenome]